MRFVQLNAFVFRYHYVMREVKVLVAQHLLDLATKERTIPFAAWSFPLSAMAFNARARFSLPNPAVLPYRVMPKLAFV